VCQDVLDDLDGEPAPGDAMLITGCELQKFEEVRISGALER
jgi:hypothetical protein